MASHRRIKGILFYPMEVDHATNKRVRLLLNDHGSDGYWIWQCILGTAYKVYGYFYPATGDDIDLLAADVCRKPPELVWAVIGACAKRGLFDGQVFEKYSVLTNDKMQMNFIRGTYDRRRKGSPIYFSEKHFLISHNELIHTGDKHLENIFFLETSLPITSQNGVSTEKTLFSTEKHNISTEKDIISMEKVPNSRKERERERERDNSTTNVVPATAAPESSIIGLKSNDSKEISDLTKKTGPAPKKKIARKKKARDPDAEPHWHILRRSWVDFNLKHLHFKVEPIPKADYSFMHRIVEKLRERATDQGVPWTEQEASVRWDKFLSTAYNSDKWLRDHFEMKNLTTQMQTIFNLVENGRPETHIGTNSSANGKQKLGTSDARTEALTKFGLAGKIVPKGD